MILVDTSVWIEFLRGTSNAATAFVREHIGDSVATSEPIMLEVLAGARAGEHTTRLERMLLSQQWLPVDPGLDYRAAVDIYQATRATGQQPRALQDCLIAAIALRNNVALAHRDRDYSAIAAATALEVIDLTGH